MLISFEWLPTMRVTGAAPQSIGYGEHSHSAHLTGGGAVDVRILGPLEVWAGERPLEIGGVRQRSPLAIMLRVADQS